MKRDKNIFEAVTRISKQRASKKNPSPKSATPPPQEKPTPSSQGTPAVPLSSRYQDPEIREMLGKIESMRTDLQKKMEDINRKTGISMEQLQKMLDNPNVMRTSNASLAKLKEEYRRLTDKAWSIAGGKKTPIKENAASSRKAKTLGARKKWIPMR